MILDFHLHLGERHRAEVVVVHPDIVLAGVEHREPRMVKARAGERPGVDVAEELPDVAVGPAIGEEGGMVENDALASHADGHLLGDMGKTLHEALPDLLHVVVPEDKVNLSIQSAEDVVPFPGAAEREIPEMEDKPVFGNGFVPVLHQGIIHLRDVLEGPGTEPEDVLMVEVGIRGEPDSVRLESPQDVFNGLLVVDAGHSCSLSIVPT